ncbi:nucleoside hydrolase [Pseudactinotalea sp. HY160]|uniref:nucleoside hydrolase n=1 Tax=Pseudactinotalea sp. HY160 TaxID=2654490 RepID=UPI00128E64FF|nr:nucleoside hydrolase [Pseudactinotalea sp. HY160]MPV50682.1 nucleoside hydrolase [Pseudactinotalea sp. HY160]
MKLLIDCDPGLDDAVAIISALKHADVEVLALTAVTGNLPADRTSANARKILELMDATDIPVAQGPLQPLSREYPDDPFSHGDDGLANTGLPEPTVDLDPRDAAQLIVDVVNDQPGEVSIAALGPLTNLALALRIDSDLPQKVRRVTAIAGSYGFTPYAWTQATGDNPVSEWNVYVDPGAAAEVFAAGFDLTAVGLDTATHPDVNLDERRLDVLKNSDRPEARFAATTVDFVRARNYQSYCALIDSMAIAALTNPEWFTTERVRCAVETAGEITLGMTVVDRRNHHAWEHLPVLQAVSDVDYSAYLDDLVETLAS